MGKRERSIAYLTMIIGIALFVFFAFFFASKTDVSINLRDNQYQFLNEGWYVIENGEQVFLDELPVNYEPNTSDGSVTIYKVLPEEFLSRQTILLRGSLQDIYVAVDGQEIYRHTMDDYPDVLPISSLWYIIDLGAHTNDKVLSITIDSPFERFQGVLNDVVYGTTAEIYAYLFDTFGYRLILSSLMFLLGFIVLIINQFIDRNKSNGLVYISAFVMIVSAWIMCESKLLQFFIPNQFVIGSLPYILVALTGIPLAFYIKDYITQRYQKIYLIMAIYFSVVAVAVVALQFTGTYQFFESVIITQVSILVGATITVILTFIEYYKYHSQLARKFLNHFFVVVIFAVAEITNFLVSDFAFTSIYGLVILTLYMVYMVFRYIIQINYRFKLSYKLEIANQLIYLDALTNGKNRHAFERDFEEVFNNVEKRKYLRLVMFDFDRLKDINDSYGHVEGDEALKLGLEVIENAFGPFGECYRIGGDEFACILRTTDQIIYKQCLENLDIALNNLNQELTFELALSVGSTVFERSKFEKPRDMYRQADQNMYDNKNKQKQKRES